MGSTPAAFRLNRDVLNNGSIDLLFEEADVNDEIYVKLIKPTRKKEEMKLVSVNKYYDNITVNLKDEKFKILGGVVWHAHSWI